jgi:hypothetical protein
MEKIQIHRYGGRVMGVKRTAIVRNTYKDASYLMFGGSGGSGGSSGVGGYGGAGANIQLAIRKEKERKKQEVKKQLREYKQQLELINEIRKQEVKIDAEIKKEQLQQNMIDPKVMDVHTRDISSPKLRNIYKDDGKCRSFLFEQIAREERDNPKEDHFIIKIIKNIGKKKPPKNMTIVQ